jgi:lipoate-protein ligase A
MKYLDLTFTEPARNLACDEALLTCFETERRATSLLRIWQPENYFVVLGHSNKLRAEVDVDQCHKAGVAVARRISGGGAVMQGPGCLNYALILNTELLSLPSIGDTFNFVLERHRQMVEKIKGAEVRIDGVSDLTIAGRKFSGNSQYRKRTHALVHGTFLLTFDLSLIERCLLMPKRQPEYRHNRAHGEFIANIQLDSMTLRHGLIDAWNATEPFASLPSTIIDELAVGRYGQLVWTEKF